MSWKKYFNVIPQNKKFASSMADMSSINGYNVSGAKYSSYLPEVYAGQPNRKEKYAQYDQMDMDPEIHASLDITADFCTQVEEGKELPFDVYYKGDITDSEIKIINTVLHKWVDTNELRTKLWEIFRNVLKYGDQFYIRDPETKILYWVDHNFVEKVYVNEAEGKKPETYIIKNVDFNLQAKVASEQNINPAIMGLPQSVSQGAGTSRYGGQYTGPGFTAGVPNDTSQHSNTIAVDAKHVLHISLNVGNDNNWPFGTSILESIFKVFKQKELLEDALIIYRVQRAPERRVFYIDIGTMPPTRAKAFLENVKNEIHQRRIPSRTGGGQSIVDASYNPMSITEDYFFAQCLSLDTKIPLLDGRTITLEQAIQEYNNGKINYTYSLDLNTFELEYGKISWAGVTRKNAQVLKVKLDNGEEVICTPDHRFILRDGSEIEAQYLKSNDSLMPFYLINSETSTEQKSDSYLAYIDNATCTKKWVHTTICPKTKLGKETEIYHIDVNRMNNTPENLIEMNTQECQEYHKQVESHSLKKQFQKLIKEINLGIFKVKNRSYEITSNDNIASNISNNNGYENWQDTKENCNFNHKVFSVEWLDNRIDTGDITVESKSNSHIFAISAGIYIHNSSDGKGSRVDTLPGGENLGEIDDLKFFDNKLKRGLGIPPSYLPSGPEDGSQSYSDGRVGTAYMQEWRFSKTCERYQNIIVKPFDKEFKKFLVSSGYNIDISSFELVLRPPQNFSKFRQIEIDSSQVGIFNQLAEQPFWSTRFLMERFLGLDPSEISRNMTLFFEENPEKLKQQVGDDSTGNETPGLEAVGSGVSDFSGDFGGTEGDSELDTETGTDDNVSDTADTQDTSTTEELPQG